MTFKLASDSFTPLIIALTYILVLYFFIGWQFSNLVFILIILVAYYAHEKSKKFVWGLLPIIIYLFIYDSMRAVPNHIIQEVDLQDIYHLEKEWFGIEIQNKILTLNEYFKENTVPFLDFWAGIIYGNWFNFPLLLAVYLFFKNKKWVLEFGFAFLLLNILGIATYYVYPLAPPWYLELYGFDWNPEAQPYEAGLENFDKMFGITLFKDMYSMNSQVFAALPSLHSSFPVVVLFYGLRTLKYMNLVFLLHMLGIWFFAVYLRHHYIIDILLGVFYAVISCLTMRYIRDKPFAKRWFDIYQSKLS